MPQPTGAPPEQWQPRTDAATRKLIQRIEELAKTLNDKIKATDNEVLELQKSVRRRLKQKVSYFALLSILGTASAFVIKISLDSSNQTRKESAADMRQLRAEQAQKIGSIETTTQGIYNVLIEGKSKAVVREEVQTNLTKIQEAATDGGYRPKQTGRANQ
jgi:hypothetical protein